MAELGLQTLEDGTQLPLPPVLLGQIGQDPQKKTILLYGHLDVQPAKKVLLNYMSKRYFMQLKLNKIVYVVNVSSELVSCEWNCLTTYFNAITYAATFYHVTMSVS